MLTEYTTDEIIPKCEIVFQIFKIKNITFIGDAKMNFEKVKDIIVDTISCDANEVTMEASLREDLGADSLSSVELIMALEDNFDIKISDEEMKEILTVGDLVNYIDSHVEQ